MTPEQQMEQFSLAYVRAVAATARVNIYRPEVDDESVDIGFAVRSFRGRPKSPRVEAQVKCTAQRIGRGRSFQFDLKVKNFNDLAGEHHIPRILIVVVVPKDMRRWLVQDEVALTLRQCGYWRSLATEPETENTSSVRVEISRENAFTVEALKELLGAGE